MGLFEALVLGLAGGLADFLPVGGSGHRVLVGRVFFGDGYDRAFAGFCELFSALGGLIALRGDVLGLIRASVRPGSAGRQEGALLLAAAVAAVLISWPFRDASAEVAGNLAAVGVLLLVSGLLLYVAEELGRRTRPLDALSLPGALLVGLLSSLAVLPGISRPATAISGAMLAGITREAATGFALLLSVPLLVAAGLFDLSSRETVAGTGAIILGGAASLVGGFAAVGFLKWFAPRFSMMAFAYYLWISGVLAIAYAALS